MIIVEGRVVLMGLELEDMDGPSQYYARNERFRLKFGRNGGYSYAQATEGGISCDAQSTFSCRECRPLFSKW